LKVAHRLYGVAARYAALTVSTWGAAMGLLVPNSLIFRVHDAYILIDYINVATLAVALLGWADIVWHDIRGKLILPSINPHFRHRVCVLLYAFLGAVWLLKSFSAFSMVGEVAGAAPLGMFALFMSSICGVTAVAIALETRA
jgi:hypothetical protein